MLALAGFDRAVRDPGRSAEFAARLWRWRGVRYEISLANASQHLVKVKLSLAPGASERELQLPVWNALYQIRDFAQYVNWVRGRDKTETRSWLRKLDKSRWHVSGADGGARDRV